VCEHFLFAKISDCGEIGLCMCSPTRKKKRNNKKREETKSLKAKIVIQSWEVSDVGGGGGGGGGVVGSKSTPWGPPWAS